MFIFFLPSFPSKIPGGICSTVYIVELIQGSLQPMGLTSWSRRKWRAHFTDWQRNPWLQGTDSALCSLWGCGAFVWAVSSETRTRCFGPSSIRSLRATKRRRGDLRCSLSGKALQAEGGVQQRLGEVAVTPGSVSQAWW